jgi:hypothetical protein
MKREGKKNAAKFSVGRPCEALALHLTLKIREVPAAGQPSGPAFATAGVESTGVPKAANRGRSPQLNSLSATVYAHVNLSNHIHDFIAVKLQYKPDYSSNSQNTSSTWAKSTVPLPAPVSHSQDSPQRSPDEGR